MVFGISQQLWRTPGASEVRTTCTIGVGLLIRRNQLSKGVSLTRHGEETMWQWQKVGVGVTDSIAVVRGQE